YIQLLTTPPAAAETALLATCLHVPSYRIEQEENSYPFAAYLFRLMQTDLPAFSHPGYREVLELLAGGRPANQLPEGLQLITGYALQECPQPLPPEEAIVYYTEIQLTREIGLLAKSLSRPTGPKERRELLAGLEAQRKLLGELAVSYRRSAVILPDRYS
ncbi:MAG: hypothetical protein LUD74_07420, partial [Tannerellaceae bacterium]|nr:hypothetical protein [Tannerellaceae bacterium]